MRIGFDHQVFGLQKHGGISRYFAELVAHLAQEPGVSPVVLAPFHINEYLLRSALRSYVRGRMFPLDFRGNARIVGAINALLLPLYWSGENFDVIHETYYSGSMHGHARVRVLTIYDMIHELYPRDFPNSMQISSAKRLAASRADHVICISETTRQDAIRILGISRERSSVIYLGCSLDAGSVPREAGEVPVPYFLYVGPRSGYKNFQLVLDAFSQSPLLRAGFHLVAFGGRDLSTAELRRISELGLSGRVRRVAGNDRVLSQYYSGATAFVYPSRYEGFGIPPLEAMSRGCPVLCSKAGSISEIVGEAGAYFDPDDSTELRLLLERVSSEKQFAAQLRLRGYDCAKKYTWERCTEKTLECYRQLLN